MNTSNYRINSTPQLEESSMPFGPHLIFCFGTGRCGTGTVAKYFQQYLTDPETGKVGEHTMVAHEFLRADLVGEMTPGSDTLAGFNCRGLSDSIVGNFWRNKLTNIGNMGVLNQDGVFVETSHLLGKCGLIEKMIQESRTLHWLSLKPKITIIFLNRNPLDTIASMYVRGDFYAFENRVSYYLDPRYTRTCLDYDAPALPFTNDDSDLRLNHIAWYYWEMRVRATLYMDYLARYLPDGFSIFELQVEEEGQVLEGMQEIIGDTFHEEVALNPEHHNATPDQFQEVLTSTKERIGNDYEQFLAPFDNEGEAALPSFIEQFADDFEHIFFESQGIFQDKDEETEPHNPDLNPPQGSSIH